MKKICDCPKTVPTEALYIDGNITPVKLIITGRRLMYYWNILDKPRTELVRQVFDAMCEFPSKGGWLELVNCDLKLLDIDLSESCIKLMTKHEFRKIVKTKIGYKRQFLLKELQGQHSKTRGLTIDDTVKSYLTYKLLSTPEKRLLFNIRCRMTRNKSNFKNKFSNLICRLCLVDNSEESLIHLTVCSFVKQHIPEVSRVTVDDIYGELGDQIRAVKIFSRILGYIEYIEQDQEHKTHALCTNSM